MKAIDIACRACASQPNERCRSPRLDLIEYLDVFHAERTLDADGFGSPDAPADIPTSVIDAAVDALGID